VLEPGAVDALLEVTLPVEETDADHRQRTVARRLEDVPGQHPEPARVDRQRAVDPELRADEHDGPVEALDPRLGARPILLEDLREARDSLAGRRVGDRARRRVRRDVRERADGVRDVDLPRVRIERAEKLVPVRVPGPAVVERDPCERRELGGQPQRELRGALVRFPRPGEGREVDESGRAHGRPR
jgi:hypothetical protein